jgi:hypothetical protein
MAFNKITHTDRVVQFAGRRTITNTSTLVAQTVDVVRAEGTVSNPGDPFNAATLNSLETRVNDQFTVVDTGLAGIKETLAWTNPSPNNDFSAQNITLSVNISGYTFYSVMSKGTKTSTAVQNTGKIPIGSGTFLMNAGVNARLVDAPSGTTMHINNDAGGTTVYDIPLYVYLHK